MGALGAGSAADVQGRARINSDNVFPLQSRRESLILASRGQMPPPNLQMTL